MKGTVPQVHSRLIVFLNIFTITDPTTQVYCYCFIM